MLWLLFLLQTLQDLTSAVMSGKDLEGANQSLRQLMRSEAGKQLAVQVPRTRDMFADAPESQLLSPKDQFEQYEEPSPRRQAPSPSSSPARAPLRSVPPPQRPSNSRSGEQLKGIDSSADTEDLPRLGTEANHWMISLRLKHLSHHLIKAVMFRRRADRPSLPEEKLKRPVRLEEMATLTMADVQELGIPENSVAQLQLALSSLAACHAALLLREKQEEEEKEGKKERKGSARRSGGESQAQPKKPAGTREPLKSKIPVRNKKAGATISKPNSGAAEAKTSTANGLKSRRGAAKPRRKNEESKDNDVKRRPKKGAATPDSPTGDELDASLVAIESMKKYLQESGALTSDHIDRVLPPSFRTMFDTPAKASPITTNSSTHSLDPHEDAVPSPRTHDAMHRALAGNESFGRSQGDDGTGYPYTDYDSDPEKVASGMLGPPPPPLDIAFAPLNSSFSRSRSLNDFQDL